MLSGVVQGIYIDTPAKFQLSGAEKKTYLDQKNKYVFTLKIQKTNFNMRLTNKSDKIKWLKCCKDYKTVLKMKLDIRFMINRIHVFT